MLSGEKLGRAIKKALDLKGVGPTEVARVFGVKPPSVIGWIKTGRINKPNLFKLMDYCHDVVGPEHWGIEKPSPTIDETLDQHQEKEDESQYQCQLNNIDHLLELATPRSQDALRQIAQAAADGRLTDDDLTLLASIAARFSGGTSQK